MTDVEMIKKMTGESDEELLSLLLSMAEEKILALTNRTRMIYPLRPAAVSYTHLDVYKRQDTT